MSSKFDGIKKGDRIRVVIEGEVTWKGDTYLDVDGHHGIRTDGTHGGNGDVIQRVEKLEPPVKTFGPGTIVRNRTTGNVYMVLADQGYAVVSSKFSNPGDTGKFHAFTSENYDRVEVPA